MTEQNQAHFVHIAFVWNNLRHLSKVFLDITCVYNSILFCGTSPQKMKPSHSKCSYVISVTWWLWRLPACLHLTKPWLSPPQQWCVLETECAALSADMKWSWGEINGQCCITVFNKLQVPSIASVFRSHRRLKCPSWLSGTCENDLHGDWRFQEC